MIKVLHFIHGLKTGGAETIVKEYALNINKDKFCVEILCLDHYSSSPYEAILKDAGIKVTYVCDKIPKIESKSFFKKIKNCLAKYLFVRKYIRASKPNILHIHLSLNNYIKFAKPKKPLKILYTVHTEPDNLWRSTSEKKHRKKIANIIDFKAAKWLVKNYNMRFIVLHDKMKNQVNKMFKVNNSIIVNNGIDFNRFNCVKSSESVRHELGIESSAFVIGHVGRFSKNKNQKFLLEVFRKIHEMNRNAILLFIGDGNELPNIQTYIRDYKLDNYVKILSNRCDIPDLLNAIDVFAFPSIVEGLGIAVIEAQKAGVHCVISENIPKSAIISNLVDVVPIYEGEEKWATSLCHKSNEEVKYYGLEEWDMKNVINKLEYIYEGKI